MNRATRGAREWAGLLLPIFCWFAVTAWIRPLTAPDEGRYIGVALEMLHSGRWMVPTLDGLPFFHKPPLFYWISAASMSVFGVTEWAGRMPSLLGATLAACSLYRFTRRWVDPAAARLSAAVLCTMPFFYVGAQFGNLDMLVAGCISATVLLTAHAQLLREHHLPWRAACGAAFAMAALSVLAKGLIGCVLPCGIFLLWCLATRRPYRALSLLLQPAGWLVFLAIALPWHIAMQARFPGFFDYFIVTQHFRRFAQAGFNNAHPFWFYLPVVVLLTLPWSACAASGPARWWKTRRRPSDADALMLCWIAVVIVFFSIPRSKLIGYVLPALPPLAYFIGGFLARASRPAGPRGCGIAAIVACLACVLLAREFASSPAAGLVLPQGSRVAGDDKVVMLDDYLYELPFYWKLHQVVYLAADWSPATAAQRDNWRKEVFDASRFVAEDGRKQLIAAQDIGRLRCSPGAVWLVARGDRPGLAEWTTGEAAAVMQRGVGVWRLAPLAPSDPPCRSPGAAS